jgi:hypothetical protein
MIGNHVYGEHRTEGSNPSLSAIKSPSLFAMGFLLYNFIFSIENYLAVCYDTKNG